MNKPLKNIGPYAIDGELGRGGMGVVYQAKDTRLDRLVAIKSLHENVSADPDSLPRFEREARALAALNHSNIAGIHGIEQDGDHLFLILEFVDGETLADRLLRGPLTVAQTLEICTQIAAGLDAAHQAGIVHRDLKPANVKITPDGQVKVLDFGLAQMADSPPTAQSTDMTQNMVPGHLATTAGTLMGTIPYMSPEQARGETVDNRSDIWSWAVIVHECLTGSNPYVGQTPSDSIAAILTNDIDLKGLPVNTPPLVVTLLGHCLQRNKHHRMRGAGDLQLLIEDCRNELTAEPSPELMRSAIVDKTFLIDDEACRTLDKEGFDPHLIGWQMQYADNERPSDVLQIWIPSFGEDHFMGIWRDLLASSPFRTIVATPVGLEPNSPYRPKISMTNQLALLRRLVTSVADQTRPNKVVVGGFS
jgi:serine/threonine protein kinase